jgi:hypothetical protein
VRELGGSSPVRQGLAVAALVAALGAQQMTFAHPVELAGWALYVAAAAMMAVAVCPAQPPAAEPSGPSPSAFSVRRIRWGLMAGLAVGSATLLSAANRWPAPVLLLWIGSFFAGAAALRRWRVSPPARRPAARPRYEVAAVAGIVVLAALARLLWIDSLPRYFFGDESRVGMFLVNTYRKGIPNFFTMGWNTWPVIGLSLQGVFAPLLGFSHTTLRLSSALMGTLAVLATYLLARELATPVFAMLAALLFAMCRTAIDFSRLGVCHAQVICLAPFAWFWWWRGVNRGSATSYWWAGVGFGLCLYTYNAGQLLPPLWFGWVIIAVAMAPRMVRTHWRGALITLVGIVVTTLPWIDYTSDHFTFGRKWYEWTFMARSRQTMTEMLHALQATGLGAALAVLRRQVWRTWLGFGVVPAGAYGIGYRGGGMLDHVTAPLFMLGLGLTLCGRWGARGAFLVYWWLVTAIVGGVLTIDPPAVVRLVGLLPVLAIIAATPLYGLLRTSADVHWRTAAGRTAVSGIVVVALLLAAGWENWRTYFVSFAQMPIDDTSELARRVQRLPAQDTVLLLGAEHFLHFTHDTGCEIFPFEFPGRRLDDVPDPTQVLPLHMPSDSPVDLILGPSQATLASYIRTLYPHAAMTDVHSGSERVVFRMLRLDPNEVAHRMGLRLNVLDHQGTLVSTTIADPFAASLPLAAAAERLRWTGSVYWPTDRPVTLRIRSKGPATLRVDDAITLELSAPGSKDIAVALPRGWHPLSIEEQARPRGLSISLQGARHALTRWDLRPDDIAEGLAAVYERGGTPILRSIDPQLNSFAVEALRPLDGTMTYTPLATMPFSVSWSGTLRVTRSGPYEFGAVGSGPYSVVLDDVPLLEATNVVPEAPRVTHAARDLSDGAHALTAHWDSTRAAHTTRRIFQVYWRPPGGESELIPPSSLAPVPPAR